MGATEDGPRTLVGVPGTWRWVLVWVGVALAGLIALNEIDRLITAASLSDGVSWSVAGLVGPGAFGYVDAWTAWATHDRDTVSGLLRLHTVCDLVFVLGYGVLLWRVIRAVTGSRDTWPRRLLRRVLALLVVAEIVEAVLLVVGSNLLGAGVPTAFRSVVATVAVIKWVAVCAFVVTVVAAPRPRRAAARHLRRAGKALKYQRLTALSLGLLAVLSLVPGRNLFDQLPDVQRRWLDSSPDGQGITHLVTATASTVVFVLVAFVVGRIRSERATAFYTAQGELPDSPAVRRWWAAVPAAVVVGACLLALIGPDDLVDWPRLALFAGVPLALAAVSFLVARNRDVPMGELGDADRADGRALAVAVAVAGDVLAFAALTVGGLGLVRSFTAPLALATVPSPMVAPMSGDDVVAQALLTALGVATLVAGPVWAPRVVARFVGAAARLNRIMDPTAGRDPVDTPARTALAIIGMTLAVAVFALFALVPRQVTAIVGVTATAALLLVAWSVVLGTAQIATQYAQPLAVFRLLGLRATPLLSLLVIIGVANGLAGGDADLHRVAGTPAPVTGRPAVEARFAQWLRDGRGCAITRPTAAGPVAVRPLLLVAARGGGIRAAYWTAHGLASLGGPGTCADEAVLLSSGVSGGSVGLALSHVVDGPSGPERLRTAAADLTSPDALAAATAGLFDADVLGNLTGVRLPSSGTGADPGWAWRDRARLMEQTWDDKVGDLGRGFSGTVAGRAGALVLNATDAPSGCRVLVSQVRVDGGGATDGALPCGPGSLVAAGADYLDSAQCPRGLSWSTAAMLSARFPFVTPAGRTQPCGTDGDGLQLVDGGYAESSGLGTLSDLAPSIMEQVRRENARVAAGGGAFVVPIVVDLNNGFGSDLAPTAPGLSLEPLVPVVGALNGTRQGEDTQSWATRLETGLADPCGTAGARCVAAALRLRLDTGTVVSLAPVTEPAVTAPLGWTLSADSRRNLETNLVCAGMARTPTCSRLDALTELLAARPAAR